jgi:hypothetical protein
MLISLTRNVPLGSSGQKIIWWCRIPVLVFKLPLMKLVLSWRRCEEGFVAPCSIEHLCLESYEWLEEY